MPPSSGITFLLISESLTLLGPLNPGLKLSIIAIFLIIYVQTLLLIPVWGLYSVSMSCCQKHNNPVPFLNKSVIYFALFLAVCGSRHLSLKIFSAGPLDAWEFLPLLPVLTIVDLDKWAPVRIIAH